MAFHQGNLSIPLQELYRVFLDLLQNVCNYLLHRTKMYRTLSCRLQTLQRL
ncbi:hypothetical protein LguiA_020654 [Lonicera macranthoides]